MGTGGDIDDAGTSSNGREGNRIDANNGVGGGDSWRLQPQSPPDAALLTEVGKTHADRLAAELNALTALGCRHRRRRPPGAGGQRRARGVLERGEPRAAALSEGRRRRRVGDGEKRGDAALREAGGGGCGAVDDDPATTTTAAAAMMSESGGGGVSVSSSPAALESAFVGDVSAESAR